MSDLNTLRALAGLKPKAIEQQSLVDELKMQRAVLDEAYATAIHNLQNEKAAGEFFEAIKASLETARKVDKLSLTEADTKPTTRIKIYEIYSYPSKTAGNGWHVFDTFTEADAKAYIKFVGALPSPRSIEHKVRGDAEDLSIDFRIKEDSMHVVTANLEILDKEGIKYEVAE